MKDGAIETSSPNVGREIGGAGDGDRTRVASLEGWSSTTELHPRAVDHSGMAPRRGGGGRIRTYVDVRRQIYSLVPLTTRPPLRPDTREAAPTVSPDYGNSPSKVNSKKRKRACASAAYAGRRPQAQLRPELPCNICRIMAGRKYHARGAAAPPCGQIR